jgi:hypothetical protein
MKFVKPAIQPYCMFFKYAALTESREENREENRT